MFWYRLGKSTWTSSDVRPGLRSLCSPRSHAQASLWRAFSSEEVLFWRSSSSRGGSFPDNTLLSVKLITFLCWRRSSSEEVFLWRKFFSERPFFCQILGRCLENRVRVARMRRRSDPRRSPGQRRSSDNLRDSFLAVIGLRECRTKSLKTVINIREFVSVDSHAHLLFARGLRERRLKYFKLLPFKTCPERYILIPNRTTQIL